jgi:hypothetical protein
MVPGTSYCSMWVRCPLLDNDPVEAPERLNILVVSQHQLDRRAVFKLRLDRKGETQFTRPTIVEARQILDRQYFRQDGPTSRGLGQST